MNVNIVNLSNQVVGNIELNDSIFGYDARPDLIHRVVVWQLAKRQAGTHQTKTISKISGTTKKPYAQKGTGRARQGSLRSPQFRGGAVIFGPTSRSHAIKLPKKIRKLGLCHALSSKVQSGNLIVVDELKLENYKTTQVVNIMKDLGLKSALFVDQNEQDNNFKAACANIVGTNILPVIGLNVYDIIRHKNIVITKQALIQLEERLK